MASAQVLPNSSTSSRKQEHLEAGKRRLEEFRKKKAAERAKKTSNSSQANNSDDNLNKKQSSEVENVRINEFDGVTTSDGVGGAGTDSSSLGIGATNHQTVPLHPQESQDFDSNASQFSLHGMKDDQSNKSSSSLKDYAVTNNLTSYFPSKSIPQNSVDALQQIKLTNSSTSDSGYSHNSLSGGFSDSFSSKFSSSDNNLPSLHGANTPKFHSTGLEARSSSYNRPILPLPVESSSRRSRPSFLDSLNVTKTSLGSPFHQSEQSSSMSNHLESSSNDIPGSTYFPKPPENVHIPLEHLAPSVVDNDNHGTLLSAKENGMEKNAYYSSSKNEDFAALEQYIEDLTKEKFSLQRALEASQVLAESLATENSTLTDNYNQQRSVVNQLRSDMEKLQEDIKAQLAELQAFKSEYTNAQLECNAADERAKLLASEVIGLEEKALRLRSSELKLEKQLENAQAEISSYRKKISSLDKDRHDLHSTIDALQEEKKLLLSKMRKVSTTGKSIESQTSKRDISTSTEDLASEDPASNSPNPEINDNDAEASSSSSLVPETRRSSLGVSPVNIPHDQMRMIENINALISELALEKEELIKSLTLESSECSRMKEINKELSRKLEVQTQRLELLTAQSMVHENISTKQPDSRIVYENTQYADEGDEVVERVLGWIMKLFPGGPSRRRTSKLL
ncbi:protein BLISTER isoform X3 [Vigna radiata var. radiata]|uniref:Protein BLISTER isoform X3 n=1 Tax=Vigna radiata var. radiata TaxID=3916 RepID=A0A3Q0F9G1_VIGRR|nr:protein BLISTER isoform X3 [Vigna radiata var. radiata]